MTNQQCEFPLQLAGGGLNKFIHVFPQSLTKPLLQSQHIWTQYLIFFTYFAIFDYYAYKNLFSL